MSDLYERLLLLADDLEEQAGKAADAIRRAGTTEQRAKALEQVRLTLGGLELGLAEYSRQASR